MNDGTTRGITTRVLVVTVSYRTASFVCRSLLAIERERRDPASSDIELRVAVIDNDSGDAAALEDFVRSHGFDTWVHVIRAERNGGFAYGCNTGIRFGYESASVPDFFYLLNPDTEVRPGAIRALVQYLLAHPRAGIAGGILEDADGTLARRAFRFPSLYSEVDAAVQWGLVTKLLRKYVVSREMGDSPESVDWVSGAAMLVRRAVLDRIGGLDEAYFLYFEETDFCRKARNAGWDVAYVPSSRVMHDAGASTGILNPRRQPKRMPSYWFESRRRFFTKNYGIAYAVATDVTFVLACLVGHAKRVALGRRNAVPPKFLRDFVRHSAAWPWHWRTPPAIEYHPSVDESAHRTRVSDGQ